jgi:hypothetical protein
VHCKSWTWLAGAWRLQTAACSQCAAHAHSHRVSGCDPTAEPCPRALNVSLPGVSRLAARLLRGAGCTCTQSSQVQSNCQRACAPWLRAGRVPTARCLQQTGCLLAVCRACTPQRGRIQPDPTARVGLCAPLSLHKLWVLSYKQTTRLPPGGADSQPSPVLQFHP